MSTLLEQASLVLIPSGYAEDKVYSVIPSNGSGDMSFTRASDGTRINSDGLVENTPWNLFQQSETFENASWTKNNISVATGIGTTPEGLPYRILTNTVNGFNSLAQTPPLVIGNFYSVTIVLKKGTAISVGFRVGAGTWGDAKYNFDTDTFVGSAVALASRRFLGDGWIEIKYQNFEALQTNFRVFVSSSTTGNSLDGLIGQTLLVSRMQLNIGSTAKPYFPTTDRLNVPRLTYQNGGGGCPSLLLEPQRTNVITYSEQFDNAYWVKNFVSVTANSATSPSGIVDADKIIPNILNVRHSILTPYNITVTSSAITASSYFKADGYNFTQLLITKDAVFSSYYSAIFDLSNGSVVSTAPFGGYVGTASIVSVGNNWYRCIITITNPTANSTHGVLIGSLSTGADVTFIGDGVKGTLCYGAQLEVGAYPSSYIPTVASSATRIADACFKTGISSLIGQTEGTIFVDVNLDARVTQTYFAISSSATGVTNYIGISFRASTIVFEVVTAGVLQASDTLTNSLTGQFKLAIGYKTNDFVFYANGTQISTDNSGTVPVCNDIVLFNSTFSQSTPMKYNQTVLFKTRLTNSELAQITTI